MIDPEIRELIDITLWFWVALMLTVQSIALLILIPLIKQTAKNSEIYKKLFGIKEEKK